MYFKSGCHLRSCYFSLRFYRPVIIHSYIVPDYCLKIGWIYCNFQKKYFLQSCSSERGNVFLLFPRVIHNIKKVKNAKFKKWYLCAVKVLWKHVLQIKRRLYISKSEEKVNSWFALLLSKPSPWENLTSKQFGTMCRIKHQSTSYLCKKACFLPFHDGLCSQHTIEMEVPHRSTGNILTLILRFSTAAKSCKK